MSYIKQIFAAIGLVLAAWFFGKKQGSDNAKIESEKEKREEAETIAVNQIEKAKEVAKREVETVQGANDVLSKVNYTDINDIANKLREKWARK